MKQMAVMNNDQIKEGMLDTLHKLQCTMQFFNHELGKVEDYLELDAFDRDMLIAFYTHLKIAYEQVVFHYEFFEDFEEYMDDSDNGDE